MLSSANLRISFLGLTLLLFSTRPVNSQEPACTERKLPVYFRDSQNLPIQGLSVTDLEARIHGKPVKIASLAPDPRPHRFVLVLDISASMGRLRAEPGLWSLELSLAQHFYEVNREKSRMALIFFNRQVTDVVDFAQGNAAVGAKLQQIAHDPQFAASHIKGQTALRDAILQATQLLEHPSSADAVYVLSDGGDNASQESASELGRRLSVNSVRVFAVVLHGEHGEQSYRNRTPEELSGPGELSEIAVRSGGEVLSAAEGHGNGISLTADPEGRFKTDETLKRLYQVMLQDNLLEIELPFLIAKNERLELRLSDVARRRWKGVQITYPTALAGCGSEVAGTGRN